MTFDQPTLLDVYPCPSCDGTGRHRATDEETGIPVDRPCRTCSGTGTVTYDPDMSDFGF